MPPRGRCGRPVAVVAIVAVAGACGRSEPGRPGPEVQTAGDVRPDRSPVPGATTVTYLANEGVLLTAGDDAVVIDGLHRFYQPDYAVLPDAEREAIEQAQGRYADIDVVIATHRHGDHVSAEAVVAHLVHNPTAELVAAPQIVAMVGALAPPPSVRSRIHEIPWEPGQTQRLRLGDLEVELLGLRHVGARHREVENLGAVVTIGGVRVVHVGDAIGDAANLARFDLPSRHLDAAFVPDWYLLDETGRAAVREHIGARRVFAVHIDPRDAAATARAIERAWPGAIPMIDPLRTWPLDAAPR